MPRSCFFAFSFYLLASPRQDGMQNIDREKDKREWNKEKKEWHELAYTEIVKYRTIWLASGVGILLPIERAYSQINLNSGFCIFSEKVPIG